MKSIRIQLAVTALLWLIAEGWIAWHWWTSPDFRENFASVGIPTTVIALVVAVWLVLRQFVLGRAGGSMQNMVLGIALLVAAVVLGGFAPHLVGLFFIATDIFRSSFHGEAGWPTAIACIFLWLTGGFFFLACMVEILLGRRAPRDQV